MPYHKIISLMFYLTHNSTIYITPQGNPIKPYSICKTRETLASISTEILQEPKKPGRISTIHTYWFFSYTYIIRNMSGVWVFKNGVIHRENQGGGGSAQGNNNNSGRRKVLVHLPTGQEVSSYASLERILTGLGWERYMGGDSDLFQFHKPPSIDLISLPRDFSKFNSIHMYDVVIKNPNLFHVRDIWPIYHYIT